MAESRSVNIKGDTQKMIVLNFVKRHVDLPFPVPVENLDMPLIEFVKKAKIANKYFSLLNLRAVVF